MLDNQLEKFTERMDFLIRDVLNITGYRIKSDLDMSLSGVYGILNGKTKPGLDFIFKFCSFYSISANYVVLGIGPIRLEDIEKLEKQVSEKVKFEIEEVINKLEDFKTTYGKE